MHAICRYSFLAYGFGCWDRVALQLQNYGITPDQVHYYVHKYTRLSSFDFFMGIRLDIDDVANWVTARLNKQQVQPRFYVDP